MDDLLTSLPPLAIYVVVALGVGIESLGIPVPGEIVLVAAALLSSRDELSISPHVIVLAGVTGAVVGDSIGYLVGDKFGDRVFTWLGRRFPKHVNDDVLAYARHVFHKYGMGAVFLGRFIALLRIFAGPLSGSMGLHYPRFLIANVAGAICWVSATTYGVYALGTVAETYLKDFSYVGLAVAVVIGVLATTVLRRSMDSRVKTYARERRSGSPAE